MRTSQGKLAVLAFALLLAFILFVPMRAGEEDALLLQPQALRMSVGDSYALSCQLSAENPAQSINFSSSDGSVASVDRFGNVRALASGTAIIHARASYGARASTQVTVVGVPVSSLSLNVNELHIDKGEYSGLTAQFNEDASDTRLNWSSSDESVVQVDSSGRVYGAGGGEAWVTATSPTGASATARINVHVTGTTVHISPNQLTLGVGAHVPLKVSYLPLDCTDGVQRWLSSDPDVLSVSADGTLDARVVGSAYVTILTRDGLTAGMEVQVEEAPSSIRLDPMQATLERGDTLQLQLNVLEEDGSVGEDVNHLVVWSSSNDSVASVDDSGLVTALSSGRTIIRAISDGMEVSCALNVQVTIQEITLDRDELYLLREQTWEPIQLHYVYSPVDPDDPTISFTSNNEQVATVSADGLVQLTGGYGTAVITASALGGARANFTVNVVTQMPEGYRADIIEPAADISSANSTEQAGGGADATASDGIQIAEPTPEAVNEPVNEVATKPVDETAPAVVSQSPS